MSPSWTSDQTVICMFGPVHMLFLVPSRSCTLSSAANILCAYSSEGHLHSSAVEAREKDDRSPPSAPFSSRILKISHDNLEQMEIAQMSHRQSYGLDHK